MEKIASKDGTTIAFDRSGSGPALLLVGGGFQHRAIDPRTAHLVELLASHFEVFHYDRRGRGDSGDTPLYAVEREIEDIEALINQAGETASVFGMSSGAVLALDAAKQLSTKIKKLALYEPPFIVEESRPRVPQDYVTQLQTLLAVGRRDAMVEYFMTKAALVPTEFVAAMRNEPFWPMFEAVAPTLIYDGLIMGDTQSGKPLPTGRWASVRQITLVIDGGASEAYMHYGAQALADILPNAQRCALEGQTHEVAPELLAPVLTKFFSE